MFRWEGRDGGERIGVCSGGEGGWWRGEEGGGVLASLAAPQEVPLPGGSLLLLCHEAADALPHGRPSQRHLHLIQVAAECA